MVKQEWRELFHNTWFKIVMLAIIIIPCVYAGVFLGSMWDPYGNTGHIPVAIVNEDQEVSYNHQSLNVGEELVKNLEDNDSMSFHFVNNDDAMKGLENGDYYMVITIPSDFSQSATTLLDTNPKKMILNYTTNPGTNYIASKMDDSAIAKIKTEVSASVTKTYAKTIFDQIATLSNGLNDAAVGTDDLDAGVKQLLNGNQTLSQNLKTLASRSLTFEDGTQTLTNGLKDYIDGVVTVHDGVYSLKNRLDQLNQSTDSLSKGINLLNDGSSRLSSGVSQYTDGVSQTYEGTQLLVSKNKELSDGMQSLSSGTATLATLNQQLNAKLQEYSQHIGAGDISGATQDMDTIQKLQKTITIITTNLNSSVNGGSYYVLKDGNVVLGDSGQPITTTITKDKTLTSGITAYTTGVQQVNKGLAQLDSQTPELVKGSQQLSQGVQSLATQAPSLVKGIQALDGGAMNLYTGMDQLVANNSKLLIG
ncbi:MAG: YhgE/Pip domain-containing protein, partial [Coprobacillus sp.]